MKKLLAVLCMLVLALCLTGTASAEDCQHENAENNGFSYENGAWQHIIDCPDCDLTSHTAELVYTSNGGDDHTVSCPECGLSWTEGHRAICGGGDDTCYQCGAQGVTISGHDNHPEDAETCEDGGQYVHSIFCSICRDYLGYEDHVADCSNPGVCQVCGASDVNGEVVHKRIILASTEDSCTVACACGAINDEGHHFHDCRAVERGEMTCDRCRLEVAELDVLHVFEHSDTRWNEEWNCEEHILRCRNCHYTEWNGHPYRKNAFQHNEYDHYVLCEECGITWLEGHAAQCGSEENTTCAQCGAVVNYPLTSHTNHPDGSGTAVKIDREQHQWSCGICGDKWNQDVHIGRCGETENIDGEWIGTCIYCGAENVHIGYHEGHPDGSEVAEYFDGESHKIFCRICGDYLGFRLHFSDCSGDERCAVCGEEGVICAYSDHVMRLIDFDKTYCYWGCRCDAYHYEVPHGVYCNSKDQNTCAECGKKTDADGIIISDTWHDTTPGYSNTHCWTKCKACGYRPYYAEHYTGCNDDDDTRCDNCWRTEEDGIILTRKHTGLDHDVWEEDGIEWHRQTCWDCGHKGKDHVNEGLIFMPIEGDPNSHLVSCSGCEFDWTENHYAVCGETKCADCDAENVTFAYHIDHRDNSECYVYEDSDIHKKYCGICGDDWGWEEHVADCSVYDPDSMTGTCLYCGKENVNVIDVKHDTQLVGFDEEHCYYNCACGEDEYNWQHVVYCDSAQGICVGCGKSVEADGIVISITWHRDYTDHNESECWNTCDHCGELYRGEHYFSCADEEQMYCSYCGSSCEEVNIENIRHTDIDFNDSGDGWHDPWCLNCGEHLSEAHEFSLYFENGGYDTCRVYCETCGYLTDWGHQGQCGEPYEHTYCLRCGAQDIHVFSHDNHVGPEMARSIDDEYHKFYCSTCDEEHYIDEHKAPVGSDKTFGTCAVCGAKNVNLHGPVTEEEYIEDGIRVFITYHEDDSKHIDYSNAETGVYYGWENYENWQDEQPTEWERRSNVVYDEEKDIYSFEFDADWGYGTKTHRISDDTFLYETGFDGELFFEDIFDENERIWNCTHWEDAGHERIVRTIECNEDWEWVLEHYYEYDVRDVPGSMLVHTNEYGEEVAQEFYTSVNDTEPSQWEHYFSIWYETDGNGNRTAIHRDFVTSEGDHGTMYFRIDGDDWFFYAEERYMGDGIGRMETNWNESEQVYCQTTYENDRPVFTIRSTSQWEIISATTWEYFSSIGPVVKEHEQRDNGKTVYEKVYTNPNDKTTYEEHTFVDENGYTWRAFTVHGVTRVAGKSILNLPENIRKIESEAFVGVPGWIVILHEGVTSIASDAFSPDTVLLVPNEKIAKLAQDAGYAWFFE